MSIRDLHVTNIGPFDDITFEFDEHINVFVGPNSSGKSTTLMTLANIVTYPFPLPGRLCKTAPAAFTVHLVGRDGQPQENPSAPQAQRPTADNVPSHSCTYTRSQDRGP